MKENTVSYHIEVMSKDVVLFTITAMIDKLKAIGIADRLYATGAFDAVLVIKDSISVSHGKEVAYDPMHPETHQALQAGAEQCRR